MGAERMAAVSPVSRPARIAFHHELGQPARPKTPASAPMMAATPAKAKAGVYPPASVQITLERNPVTAPAHGPASTPTRMVPIESRYSGTLMSSANCPTAILIAMAIGIMTRVTVLNWRLKESMAQASSSGGVKSHYTAKGEARQAAQAALCMRVLSAPARRVQKWGGGGGAAGGGGDGGHERPVLW